MSDHFPIPPAAAALRLLHAGLTDIGCRREKNEDAFGIFPFGEPPQAHLVVVADGVGGNAAGEVASRIAVETLGAQVFADGLPEDSAAALHAGLQAVNRAIMADAAANPLRAGMATTCTAVLVRGQELVVGHIGDCRAYLAHDGQLFPLTEDHSMAGEYRRRGQDLPPDQQNLANVLTRWLGTEPVVEPDLSERLLLAEGATLVLCSDGLTKVVPDPEIMRVVSMHLPPRACQLLVERARKAGGPDNITVLVARLSRT